MQIADMVRHRFVCSSLKSMGRVLAEFNKSKEIVVCDVVDGLRNSQEPDGWRACLVFYYHTLDKSKHIWYVRETLSVALRHP